MKYMVTAAAAVLAAIFTSSGARAQTDTTGIYDERQDSLQATVFVSRQSGNYLSKGKDLRTEVISAAGLCKMACCNLAESFENSASVTVGYSDAVTGARQIRLLGLSGTYTQMLDENRPVMRGLASPFGLSYVPGQWLESIQIAKGAASVINGTESMTGQINLEHRKPTDEKPLFINYSVMDDTKMDFNVASSLQMGYKWSTVLLGHVSGNVMSMDGNGDGFLDDPHQLQFNFANRWLYMADNGIQLRFGVRALKDSRDGGEEDAYRKGHAAYNRSTYAFGDAWGSSIRNKSLNGYLKLGVPLNDDNSQNIALVADWNFYSMDMWAGASSYLADQNSGFVNLLYQNELNESHKFTLGASSTVDIYNEEFIRKTALFGWKSTDPETTLAQAGAFGEYTYHLGTKLSAIAGLRADWYGGEGVKLSPRATLKWQPLDEMVVRANGGRGIRRTAPLADNLGVLSTGKAFYSEGKPVTAKDAAPSFFTHNLEEAWTFGGNMTFYLPFGASSSTYFSIDYFHTGFNRQLMVDYEHIANAIDFYVLDGKRSYTDNWQLDFSVDPIERFTVTTTFRYTKAMAEYADRGLAQRPMTSRFKGVLNLQYATNLNKWIFDFTASVNGPCRVYDFMAGGSQIVQRNGGWYSPVYPLLYAQVTRRFKGVDIYAGGENLSNFRQKTAILGSKEETGRVNTAAPDFDASCIWGPIMGIKLYAGVRFTLWKTE
ncbi:MAG: TonB-dependent receptor [Bacteroidales bacterium]|nr:TonB-dependent receptor [Bacteroidales bacterium]